MESILVANNDSQVQQQVTRDPATVEKLNYASPYSYPNLAKKLTEIGPYISYGSNPPHSASETFNIPIDSMWYAARLRFDCRIGAVSLVAADTLDTWFACNIIDTITILSGGQPFATLYGESIKALIMDSPPSEKLFESRYAQFLDTNDQIVTTVTAGVAPLGAFTSYLGIKFSWFSPLDPSKALDLSSLTQIQLQVSYKSASQSGLRNPLASMVTRLQVYKYRPDPAAYLQLKTLNKTLGVLREEINYFREVFPCTGGADVITIPQVASDCFFPVLKTHIMVVKNDNLVTFGCPQLLIKNVNVSISGEVYYQTITNSTAMYEKSLAGMGMLNMETSLTPTFRNTIHSVYTIDWSLLCTRNKVSGLAAFAGLNRPVFTVIADNALMGGASGTSFNLVLAHEYWNILMFDPDSKTISIRAAH